jgi:hypothetical protein
MRLPPITKTEAALRPVRIRHSAVRILSAQPASASLRWDFQVWENLRHLNTLDATLVD